MECESENGIAFDHFHGHSCVAKRRGSKSLHSSPWLFGRDSGLIASDCYRKCLGLFGMFQQRA